MNEYLTYRIHDYMAFIRCLMLIFTIGMVCSCNSRSNKQLVNRAETLVMEQPGDALALLDSVDARLLNERQYARFVVLRTRARERNGLDISTDTVVFEARDYFTGKEQAPDAAMACYVAAMVYESQKKTDKALMRYYEANRWADQAKNHLLNSFICYNIARLHFSQHLYPESLYWLKPAMKYENMADSKDQHKIYTLEMFGFNYIFLKQIDSALIYYNRAMKLANQINDTLAQRRIFQNQSFVYRESGDYRTARKKCMKSLALVSPNDSLNRSRLNMILASIHLHAGEIDSASSCAYWSQKILDKKGNLFDLKDLYELLSTIEERKGNPEKAAQHEQIHKAYKKSLDDANRKIQEDKKKYPDNRIWEIREQRKIFRLQIQGVSIISTSALTMLLMAGFFYRYRSNMKKRVRQEIEEKEQLNTEREQLKGRVEEEIIEKEQLKDRVEEEMTEKENLKKRVAEEITEKESLMERIEEEVTEKEQLKERVEEEITGKEAERYQLRKEVCHAWLVHYFKQVRSSSELKRLLDEQNPEKAVRRYANKMAGEVDWDDLYWFINEFYAGLPERIRTDIKLSEKDFQACVLSYAGWGTYDISTLLRESESTSGNRRNDLRKKLGIKERGSFQVYLNQKYDFDTDQQLSEILRKAKPRW